MLIKTRPIKNVYFLLIIINLLIFVVGCTTGISGINKEENKILFQKNLDLPEGSDGKIVFLEKIILDNKYNVNCYKMKYLSDGLKVVGFLLKPKGESSKYPVMIFNRGGNREFGKITKKYLIYLSYLSSNNYVVLASQYRGNDGGQGREEFGGKDVNDVLNLIIMAKSLPFVEQNQIVMLGSSRGGMMTYLAIKNGAKIKAAAIVGGLTDLVQWDQERKSIGEKVLEQLIFPHNREEYKKRSAYCWPERINVPVLILHGKDDWRVKVSQAKKLSKKLTELGKVHELVIFPEGDHALRSHRPEKNRLILKWFDKYLKQ